VLKGGIHVEVFEVEGQEVGHVTRLITMTTRTRTTQSWVGSKSVRRLTATYHQPLEVLHCQTAPIYPVNSGLKLAAENGELLHGGVYFIIYFVLLFITIVSGVLPAYM